MDTTRPCGCKGIRTCLICEKEYGIIQKDFPNVGKDKNSYVYCPWCNKAWPGWDVKVDDHPKHVGEPIEFPGIFIQLEFLSKAEEDVLMKGIDEMAWDPSQSGRRKQNFGPKCNFKKKKLRLGNFSGFPAFTKFVQEKFNEVDILKGYQTVEQCSLEYNPDRGASIDPHIDDCWVWGERIVTVNLLADSVLTMTPYSGETKRYNLLDVSTYPSVLDLEGKHKNNEKTCFKVDFSELTHMSDVIVRVPMPRRSLLVMYGPARYLWEHSVLREDVEQRRVCLAYREFTPLYLKDGLHENEGDAILDAAKNFWDHKNTTI
ncbi:Alpha-ketoglutarate-dependent dioxygenase alkB 4 [Blattella germanica]|nr:Alpha-ketoglutarate-dependent dioxygenase alkB 4 [Blattella germanica]